MSARDDYPFRPDSTTWTVDDWTEMCDEIDRLRRDLQDAENENDTISAFGGAIGGAIGWDTPGETWVDKARFLKHFYTEHTPHN